MLAQELAARRPGISVERVNENLRTAALNAISFPIARALPVMMLMMPGETRRDAQAPPALGLKMGGRHRLADVDVAAALDATIVAIVLDDQIRGEPAVGYDFSSIGRCAQGWFDRRTFLT